MAASVMSSRSLCAPLASGTGALLILALLAFAGGLDARAPEHYYRAVQEDGYVEWASFWSFALAAGAFLVPAFRSRRTRHSLPWLSLGAGVFCLLVALEEVSWGQRLLGFRPPAFFLGQNFQQELNFHNLLASRLRELTVEFTILAYGILLPVAMQIRVIGPRLERWSAPSPPPALMPAFAAMLVTYIWYPWDFTGEWVELALGFGFLFAAIADARRAEDRRRPSPGRQALRIGAAWLVVLLLGATTTVIQSARASNDPARVVAARLELAALGADLSSPLGASRCGMHKRLYTLVHERRWEALRKGRYTRFAESGVPKARIDYQLDPWNSPYWVRDQCTEKPGASREAYLYSFGPNRRRDSTAHGIAGDDIGILLALEGRIE